MWLVLTGRHQLGNGRVLCSHMPMNPTIHSNWLQLQVNIQPSYPSTESFYLFLPLTITPGIPKCRSYNYFTGKLYFSFKRNLAKFTKWLSSMSKWWKQIVCTGCPKAGGGRDLHISCRTQKVTRSHKSARPSGGSKMKDFHTCSNWHFSSDTTSKPPL